MSGLIRLKDVLSIIDKRTVKGKLQVAREVLALPTIEPEPQTGKWKVFYECPYCGEISMEPSAKCPCCQKDMA